jgi:hypothetical protein
VAAGESGCAWASVVLVVDTQHAHATPRTTREGAKVCLPLPLTLPCHTSSHRQVYADSSLAAHNATRSAELLESSRKEHPEPLAVRSRGGAGCMRTLRAVLELMRVRVHAHVNERVCVRVRLQDTGQYAASLGVQVRAGGAAWGRGGAG